MVVNLTVPVSLDGKNYSIEATLFDTPVLESEIGTFEIFNNGDYDELFQADSETIIRNLKDAGEDVDKYIPWKHWQEVVLLVAGNYDVEPPMNLKFWPVSSYTIQASRNGFQPLVMEQAGITLWLKTLDKQVLIGGVRGGQDLAGTIAQVGGGVELNDSQRHPLYVAAENQSLQEIGYRPSNIRIIGHFSEPHHYRSRTFVAVAEVYATKEQIIKTHADGLQLHEDAIRRGLSHLEAKAVVEKVGLPKDAYEHESLLFVPDMRDDLIAVASTFSERFNPIGTVNAAIMKESLMMES